MGNQSLQLRAYPLSQLASVWYTFLGLRVIGHSLEIPPIVAPGCIGGVGLGVNGLHDPLPNMVHWHGPESSLQPAARLFRA